MNSPHVLPGFSDAGAHVKFFMGTTYPTDMLTWMVREHQTMTLEEAHYRLSALPAHVAGIRDRGVLRPGMAADLVVYDLEQLSVCPAEVIRDLPGDEWRRVQRSKGYRWVIVNGDVIYEDGKSTGVTPGALLRHGVAAAGRSPSPA
jgi:N-acyl-D-aspartate/D-glutamate deacylase